MRPGEASSTPPPFPWEAVLSLGFGRLRLSSTAFWAMTPRELAAAANPAPRRAGAMTRTALDALMRTFPD